MNKKTYSQVLDDVAHDRVPAGLDLAPQVTARIRKGKSALLQPRLKGLALVVVILLVMALVLVNVPGVAAAIQRWFGYVPGIGLVQGGQIRVLAAPASLTRDGITLTVEQALLDPGRTVLVYSVEGLSSQSPSVPTPGAPDQVCLSGQDTLRLPDGTLLPAGRGGGESAWATGYRARFDYAAVPAGVDHADLLIPCLLMARHAAAPENWDIPIRFVPAPPGLTAFPVIEIPTPSAPPATPAAQGSPVSNTDGITLTIDRAVQMDDGYLIYASLHWQPAYLESIDLVQPETTVHLLDAGGHAMLYESVDDENTGLKFDEQRSVFALKTAPVQAVGPLTILVDSVSATLPEQAQAAFPFDPGPHPQPGQTWQLDRHVQIGKYTLQVLSATAGPAFSSGYSFDMKSDTGVLSASLGDLEHPVLGGGGAGADLSGLFSGGFTYADKGLPAGPLTITVSHIAVRRDGPWQAQWTPPAASAQGVPTHPAACLNASSWQAAKEQNSALPAGLSGRVLTYGPAGAGSAEWSTALSNLDGSDRRVFATARDGSLSPDGSKLAYSTDSGIYVTDLVSNRTARLPGTAHGDLNPLWSPDGSQIVFMRGMGIFDLFMVDAGGSHLHSLTSGGVQEWPLGWTPDGRQLLYSVPGRENETANYQLDLKSGERRLFSNENIVSISPDGKHQVTQQPVFGERWTLSVSDVDGSNPWLLADSDLRVSSPTWSPDARWLLAGVADEDPGSTTGALINVQDCRIIALPYFRGNILSWGP